MPDKQSFYQSINETTTFDNDFFKKVYGYSVCDDSFLPAVAAKLISIGRKDIVQAYNDWFSNWKAEDDKAMKSVANWYAKESDKEFERLQKEQQWEREHTGRREYRFTGLPQDW
ncbi:MAG: hypothetical protein ACK5JH_11240 [Anaerocolumna sp.]